jgi:hypothetical protein
MKYEGGRMKVGRRRASAEADVSPRKRFSPPRPSGREGLMFPPEQFLNLPKDYATEMRGATIFYNFFCLPEEIGNITQLGLVGLIEIVVD